MSQGKIIIVAGFQGIDEKGDVHTLGRGGSDTSAVALAVGLDADFCEIYTDVEIIQILFSRFSNYIDSKMSSLKTYKANVANSLKKLKVNAIKNEFFGGGVNVSGLVVGRDIINQLKGKIKTPVSVIISKRDLFTVNYMQAESLWKRYAENPAAIYFMNSKNHYFQNSSTEKIIVILQKFM